MQDVNFSKLFNSHRQISQGNSTQLPPLNGKKQLSSFGYETNIQNNYSTTSFTNKFVKTAKWYICWIFSLFYLVLGLKLNKVCKMLF